MLSVQQQRGHPFSVQQTTRYRIEENPSSCHVTCLSKLPFWTKFNPHQSHWTMENVNECWLMVLWVEDVFLFCICTNSLLNPAILISILWGHPYTTTTLLLVPQPRSWSPDSHVAYCHYYQLIKANSGVWFWRYNLNCKSKYSRQARGSGEEGEPRVCLPRWTYFSPGCGVVRSDSVEWFISTPGVVRLFIDPWQELRRLWWRRGGDDEDDVGSIGGGGRGWLWYVFA